MRARGSVARPGNVGNTVYPGVIIESSVVIAEIVGGFPLMSNVIGEEVRRSGEKRLFRCFLASLVKGVFH